MAGSEATNAPLHDAEKRSRSREQGAHVRLHGSRSSRRRAIGEHRREVSATRRRWSRHAQRNGFGDFCRNKSRTLAAEASGTKTRTSTHASEIKINMDSGFDPSGRPGM